jgi:hypothetical protein
VNRKIYKPQPILSSEITPEHIYFSRRDFMKGVGLFSAGALLAACAPGVKPDEEVVIPPEFQTVPGLADEFSDPANTYEQITTYNNYYEFTTDKGGVASLAENYQPRSSENATNWRSGTQTSDIWLRRPVKTIYSGRTHLSSALC